MSGAGKQRLGLAGQKSGVRKPPHARALAPHGQEGHDTRVAAMLRSRSKAATAAMARSQNKDACVAARPPARSVPSTQQHEAAHQTAL